ncbi:hypothetical protein JTB14_031254 [Gonioctena quinquepunctata]|nr:hypothetical protein JTB14_031254 [Gonioctena quinquepunctata]
MWIAWSTGIFVLQDFVVPRCVVAFPHDNLQLHIFADGSPRAYGALAYIRCSFVSQITVDLLMAKNRVAPIKQTSNDSLTLPKLELTASLCVSRLSKYIEEKLSIVTNQIFIWSDSKIALYWISGDPSRWKPYVANRMNPIRKLSNMITFWKRRKSLLERFWKFCISEYLQQLRSAHFTIFKRSSRFRVGQVVLLYEQGLPRLL